MSGLAGSARSATGYNLDCRIQFDFGVSDKCGATDSRLHIWEQHLELGCGTCNHVAQNIQLLNKKRQQYGS